MHEATGRTILRSPQNTCVWCAALAALALASGCAKEYRISYARFLEMQRSMAAAPEPVVEEVPSEPLNLEPFLGPYKVGPSDVLVVTLTRADATGLFPTVQVRIDRNGEIELPIVGQVKVAGMELEDVEDAIRGAFVPNVLTDGVVHVDLAVPDTTNVLVVGAVTTAGLVPLRRTERNLLFALVGAGGVSSLASGKATLRRIRHPDNPQTFDLTDPVQLKQALAIEPLESGDIVYVDAASPNTVFVGGLVARTSPQTYPPGTSVSILQALAASGGVRTDVTPKQGTLIRRMPNGEDVHVKLDLDALAMGNVPNINLLPGDILWVPETFGTKVQDFINKNLYMRAGVSVNYSVSGIEFMNRHSQQSSGAGSSNLQDSFDPFGFLNQNSALQGINSRIP